MFAATSRTAAVGRFGALALGSALAGGVPANGPPGSSTDAPAVVTAAPTCNLADFRAELLRRVNELRAAGADCGSQGNFGPTLPLVWNEALAKAAEGHSRDMGTQDYLEHVGRNGSTPAVRVDAQGYAWSMVAENIAGGQPGIAEVMESWRLSPGHCANLMKPGLKEIGVACVRASGTRYRLYWTMVLGAPPQM
ncbi:MAG TPA: CAP domain-containing protein [Burkholderiaceae bacterium]|nr:CAP domain-containing protein [Burkholderiaceae bacterium]